MSCSRGFWRVSSTATLRRCGLIFTTRGLLALVGVTALMVAIVVPLGVVLRTLGLASEIDYDTGGKTVDAVVSGLGLAFLYQGFGEELLWRGYLQRHLPMGLKPAIWVSAAPSVSCTSCRAGVSRTRWITCSTYALRVCRSRWCAGRQDREPVGSCRHARRQSHRTPRVGIPRGRGRQPGCGSAKAWSAWSSRWGSWPPCRRFPQRRCSRIFLPAPFLAVCR